MADYTDNALLASIKALNEVVAPALDPGDPLASEQLRLVAGFLKFLRSRLPHLQDRNRFELEHYLALGQRLATDAQLASSELARRLAAVVEEAQAVAGRDRAGSDEVRAATAALTATIGGLMRVAAGCEPALRSRLEQAVLAAAKPVVDMHRTWFLIQGFELHPEELPTLEGALSVPPSR